MKKTLKQIIEEILICIVTLAAGALISSISFNLFDTLTRSQVRVLFAIDIIILLVIGTAALLIYESKQSKKEREARFRERHSKRIENHKKRMSGIDKIISYSNYAA